MDVVIGVEFLYVSEFIAILLVGLSNLLSVLLTVEHHTK